MAYTTVGTILAKMEENGQVTHRCDGRVNVYHAIIRRDQVSRTMVGNLADRLFHGEVKQMVCHLLNNNELTHDDLAALKRLIRQKEKDLKDE